MSDSRHEIERLMFLYAECVDQADFDGLARLFARGRMTSDRAKDGYMKGDQIKQFYAKTNRVHPGGTLCTRHLATNIILDIDEANGTASARSYYVVFQATDKLPFQPIVGGRYHDKFERDDDGWRFEERTVLVDQIGNMSEHLSIDLRAGPVDGREFFDPK